MENMTTVRTDEVAEERDLVGVYLHEISKTSLLDAAQEVDLSKAIEAGLYARALLDAGTLPDGATLDEMQRVLRTFPRLRVRGTSSRGLDARSRNRQSRHGHRVGRSRRVACRFVYADECLDSARRRGLATP